MLSGAGLGAPADGFVETACARIYLIGDTALKLKRPVRYDYLDFSTRERRAWALERELAFNGETAPGLYRRVHRAEQSQTGWVLGDGEGEPVLEMRRFREADLLASDPARLDGAAAEALGRLIARRHAAAEPDPQAGGPAALGYTVNSNRGELRALADKLGADAVEALIAATDAAFAAAGPLMRARQDAGLGRRCHADLHLGNIVLPAGGEAQLFDCIEFNDTLSHIDVLYDLAFLLMDLQFRGAAPAACRVLDGWLDQAARKQGVAAHRGFALLPLYMSVRAAVRAHVTLHGDAPDAAERARAYLAAAAAHLAPPPARLVAVGGLSGSGKTTFARAAAPALGAAPGAAVLRTDELRKRLWGSGPLERLPPQAYGPGSSERVYARLLEEAGALLDAGRTVILDGVFLRPEERAAAMALADARNLPFHGVWLEAPPDVLRQRVEARTGDASDADTAVLAAQLTRDPGDVTWTRVPADRPMAERVKTAGFRA